jgi:hypothetical protein
MLTSVTLSLGQTSRDAWKYEINDEHVITSRNLDKYISDLSEVEQSQIWQLINGSFKEGRESVSDQKKRFLAMNAGEISLSVRGEKQVIVQGTGDTRSCSPTGNCAVWLFTRERGKLRLILSAEAVWIVIGESRTKGMADLTLRTHMSADDSMFDVYRWNGSKYEPIDCYTTDRVGKISGC